MSLSDGLLCEVIGALGIAAFIKPTSGAWFECATPIPEWVVPLCREIDGRRARVGKPHSFLESFLFEARSFWRLRHAGRIRSDLWVEVDSEGCSHTYEASAVYAAGRRILLIESAVEQYRRAQKALQRAREPALRIPAKLRTAVVALNRETRDRQRAESALHASEQRFRDFAESAADWFWEVGRDLQLRFASGGFEKVLGIFPERIAALTRQAVHNDDQPNSQAWRALLEVLGSRVPFQDHQLTWLRPDGTTRYLSISGKPLVDEFGAFSGYRGVGRDVTRRTHIEEELRQQRAELAHVARVSTMGEMATGLAHELNQPLTAMASYCDVALDIVSCGDESDDELSSALVKASEQAHRAGEIIRRVREFASTGKTQKSAHDVNVVVRETVALTEADARANGVGVVLTLAETVPDVRMDKIQIQQVLVNLLRNSIEAMDLEGIENKRVTIETVVQPTGGVQVAVRDNGPGLDADCIAQLFETFETTKPQGMGMGLSISRSIVEAHGGTLWAETTSPGATFRFTLPAIIERGG